MFKQTEKQIGLIGKSAKTKILTFYRHYQSGEDPIISNEK